MQTDMLKKKPEVGPKESSKNFWFCLVSFLSHFAISDFE